MKPGPVIRSQELVERIKPILAGQGPGAQSAALADLTAMWLAGHDPLIRETVFAGFVQLIRDLVEPNEKIIFGEEGHPGRRRPMDVEPS